MDEVVRGVGRSMTPDEFGCRVAAAALNEISVPAWVHDDAVWLETEITEKVPAEAVHRAIQLGRQAAGLPEEAYAEWVGRMDEDGLGDMADFAKWLERTHG